MRISAWSSDVCSSDLKTNLFQYARDFCDSQYVVQAQDKADLGIQRCAQLIELDGTGQYLGLLWRFDGAVETLGQALSRRPQLRPFNNGQGSATIGQQYSHPHGYLNLLGAQTGSVPAAFAFGKDTDRLAARLNQGLYVGLQQCAGHGLRKGDVNDNLGCGIDLNRIEIGRAHV